MAVYTLGIWTASPGREDEFVEAWRSLAAETASDFPGSTAMLLRDRDSPNRFISYGPWKSLEEIASWRESVTFRDGVARIRELVEHFEPHTMDVAASVGLTNADVRR